MCWYSVDHAEKVLQAEAGQRLAIRKVHGRNWAVPESDVDKQRPTPVCMLDRTTVLFRFSEEQQAALQTASEVKAVFHMLTAPKRDILRFSDGRELLMEALPANVILDVIEVPGKEELSALLRDDHEQTMAVEVSSPWKSLRERVLQIF
jgi:hypothetical protein